MPGLVAEQAEFLVDFTKLLAEIYRQGFVATGGELERTLEQQKRYFEEGKSKTMNSMHLKRLAIDLHIFKGGMLIDDHKVLKPLGDFWEALDAKNRWGGSWRGAVERGESHFIDSPHFERYIP